MLNIKILVCYLYYHNKSYRTPQHFQKFWPKTWGGGVKYMLPPPLPHDIRHGQKSIKLKSQFKEGYT